MKIRHLFSIYILTICLSGSGFLGQYSFAGEPQTVSSKTIETSTQQTINDEIEVLKKAALTGDVNAQNELAVIYYQGKKVKKDNTEAVKWLKMAAEKGDATAQARLGLMYRDGLGVEQDRKQAMILIKKSADQGNAVGQVRLGTFYEGVGAYSDAIKWYKKSSAQGNEFAKMQLDKIYFKGLASQEDYDKYRKELQDDALQNNGESMYRLGLFYYRGLSVEQDYTEAAKWFKKAADLNHAMANLRLSMCHAMGRGVEIDFDKYVLYAKKAAQLGEKTGLFSLAVGYKANKKYEEAYMWVLLVDKNVRDIENLKAEIAKKLSPQQILNAEQAAKKCLTANYHNCSIE
ncbi:sel1 repeat family protein (plasmid) [Bartonella sp. HY329]|uniref:tetratricopeptide repeat protein n=1 Tax=unclassified Bartonella TaxID=2645622 RepID=UPI0021C736CD|nr:MULTISPECIES: tetratricopeptide repeat protein [unclassified Bartonella]UXM96557.1 sel1 repeat family protein [Bartonella sp. HY329]UXN10880.1 sel1 repeat family protein [Bartonella sp. HY328]